MPECDFAHLQDNVNPLFLRMLESTALLFDAAHIKVIAVLGNYFKSTRAE